MNEYLKHNKSKAYKVFASSTWTEGCQKCTQIFFYDPNKYYYYYYYYYYYCFLLFVYLLFSQINTMKMGGGHNFIFFLQVQN